MHTSGWGIALLLYASEGKGPLPLGRSLWGKEEAKGSGYQEKEYWVILVGVAHPKIKISKKVSFSRILSIFCTLYFSALLKSLLPSACTNHK